MDNRYKIINTPLEGESSGDPFTEKRYIQFFSHLKDYNKILDVGCGNGRGGIILKELNPLLKLDGVEIVDEFLNIIPKNIYEKIYSLEEINLNIPDNSYDIIIAGEFIEHLYEADVQKLLMNFFRILKIGGQILLTTPNPYYIKLKFNNKSVLGRSHVSQHFPKILKLKLQMNGFRHIQIHGSGRVSNILGKNFPLFLYGSYLIKGIKI